LSGFLSPEISNNIEVKLIYLVDYQSTNTVKPAHEVTSIKQSPVLKGHIIRPLFLGPNGDLLIQV